MSPIQLKTRSVKDLADLAKKKKIPGWHAMRKEELIKALVRLAHKPSGKNGNSHALQAPNGNGLKKKMQNPQVEPCFETVQKKFTHLKDLALRTESHSPEQRKDRLVVMIRDPFWLHAYWELSRKSIERVRVALGPHWHAARPLLRLCEIYRGGSVPSARRTVRDIRIHGGVNHWYIDVPQGQKAYQLEIGYLGGNGRFLALARSNIVTTPATDAGDTFDKNWSDVAKDFDRIYALSGGYTEQETQGELKELPEEQLQRPLGEPVSAQIGPGAPADRPEGRQLPFEVDAELIVHGVTDPEAYVTLQGKPVRLRSDGTFAVRFHLPNRRHILPVVTRTKDGSEQRTIVLSIERNTKFMEPLIREPGE